jgi:hypothetical protein
MDLNLKNKSLETNLTAVNVWKIIIKYYYVIILSTLISIFLSQSLINNIKKVEYTSSLVFETASFMRFDRDSGQTYRKFLLLDVDNNVERDVAKSTNKNYPNASFTIDHLDEKSFKLTVVSNISLDYVLKSIKNFQKLYRENRQSKLDERRRYIGKEKKKIDTRIKRYYTIDLPKYEGTIQELKSTIDSLEKISELELDNLERIELEIRLKEMKVELLDYETEWRHLNMDTLRENLNSIQTLEDIKEEFEFELPEENYINYTIIEEPSNSEREIVGMNSNLILILASIVGAGGGSILAFFIHMIINYRRTK